MKANISPIYWLWIPVIVMAVQIALELSLPGDTLSVLLSENGPHETLQAIVMVIALFVAVKALLSPSVKDKFLKAWFGLAAICCFYVAGEEVSWGQHIWDWATPDYWKHVNDQEETNIHNTSSWFDQKPRLILLLGIVGGAVIAPVLQKYNLLKLPEKINLIMPSPKLAVIALLVVIPQLAEKFFELFDIAIFARFSEVQELYMFYFVLIYLIMLSKYAGMTKNP
jgi:hypothetical protein